MFEFSEVPSKEEHGILPFQQKHKTGRKRLAQNPHPLHMVKFL
jgi:hypothetical protein